MSDLHTHDDGTETLYHAAGRVLRFLKIDENQGGGLLSIDTMKACDMLSKAMVREERRQPPPPPPEPVQPTDPPAPLPGAPGAALIIPVGEERSRGLRRFTQAELAVMFNEEVPGEF